MNQQQEQSSLVLSGFSCRVKKKRMIYIHNDGSPRSSRRQTKVQAVAPLFFQRRKHKRETAFAATSSEGAVAVQPPPPDKSAGNTACTPAFPAASGSPKLFLHRVYCQSVCDGGTPHPPPPPPPPPTLWNLRDQTEQQRRRRARCVCCLNIWSISTLGGIALVAVIAERILNAVVRPSNALDATTSQKKKKIITFSFQK